MKTFAKTAVDSPVVKTRILISDSEVAVPRSFESDGGKLPVPNLPEDPQAISGQPATAAQGPAPTINTPTDLIEKTFGLQSGATSASRSALWSRDRYIKSGKLKAFAVSWPKRSAMLPDVPTFAELGYPQLEATGWMGLWVKPDVPAAVQTRLREAVVKVMSTPAARARLQEVGFDAPGAGRTPEELSKVLAADYERVGAVLRSIGFQPE